MTAGRLRIALVHPFSWPEVRRGGERYLADLGTYLAGAGHHVEVLTGTTHSSVTEDVGGVVVRRFRNPERRRLLRRGIGPVETFGAAVLPTLVRSRYDVVHAFTPTAALAGRASRHRTLYTVLGQPDSSHFAHHRTERRITGTSVRWSSEVAALSRAAAATVGAVFGRSLLVLPPGVSTESFRPRQERRTGPPRVLFPADASDRRKRVDLALGAMIAVLDRHPDARLLLGGPGDHRWALEALGSERPRVEAATEVLGVGSLDDVPDRYRRATVTVLPSTGEAFGLGVVESLACGTPVVCLPGGGPEEILRTAARGEPVGAVAGEATPAAVAAALVDAIALAQRPDVPGRCTAHARRWDWTSVGPAHERVYHRLAGA